MRPIVLASTSPWRAALLRDAGIVAVCEAPGVDERAVVIAEPSALASELARRKAWAVAPRHPDAWVIGADQVVTDGREIWGKPVDADDHLARLRGMVGMAHQLVTGWCVVGPEGEAGGVVVTTMRVRADLEDAELRAYVATGEGTGCAGGYAAEGRGAFLFEAIDGEWSNVIGLPMSAVLGELRRRGWRFRGEAA